MRRWLLLSTIFALFLLPGCGLYRTAAERLVRLEHPLYPNGITDPGASAELQRDLDACKEELKPQSRYFMSMATAWDLIFACLKSHGWQETAARVSP